MSSVIDMVEVLDEDLYPEGLTVGYDTDAALDLAIRDARLVQVHGGRMTRLPLGVALHLPPDHAGLIIPRSSAAEEGLIVPTTLVDPGYTGEVHAWVFSVMPIRYTRGQKLVQLLIVRNLPVKAKARKAEPRGAKAMGSSGETE